MDKKDWSSGWSFFIGGVDVFCCSITLFGRPPAHLPAGAPANPNTFAIGQHEFVLMSVAAESPL